MTKGGNSKYIAINKGERKKNGIRKDGMRKEGAKKKQKILQKKRLDNLNSMVSLTDLSKSIGKWSEKIEQVKPSKEELKAANTKKMDDLMSQIEHL
jgi:hypothetical protein